MRRVFRITTAAYPAMTAVAVLAFFLSARAPAGLDRVTDRVFPFLRYEHAVGAGSFTPGSFALNFFVSAGVLMAVLNLVLPDRFAGPLLAGRANVFYYILALVLAIFEVAADTLIPLVALHGRHGFGLAVTLVHGGFIAALALAAMVSKGADREW